MLNRNPYDIVKSRYITEKASVLGSLQSNNKSKGPKYVFLVDKKANKYEIAAAIEEIYAEKNVKVVAVNTINMKSKARRVRGRSGRTSERKKAIVTLEAGDRLDSEV